MKVNFKKPAIAENSIGKKTNTKTKKTSLYEVWEHIPKSENVLIVPNF